MLARIRRGCSARWSALPLHRLPETPRTHARAKEKWDRERSSLPEQSEAQEFSACGRAGLTQKFVLPALHWRALPVGALFTRTSVSLDAKGACMATGAMRAANRAAETAHVRGAMAV